ncbi:MAG: hypothetical protein PHU85_19290, partial [Phycisphaerae bacterium]|nr:hypothetical protein [Phycisphaerae bacterium]
DPESKKSKLWINGNMVCEGDLQAGPKTGKHVMVGTQYGCRIKSIRVTAGMASPAEASGVKSDVDVINFTNKDHLTAKSIALADGEFLVQTPYGELKSPANKVAGIVFNTKDQEKPRRLKGEVLVQTNNSRLTVQPESLDGETLSGTSDYLGKITVKRSLVKSIRFNINP